MKYKFAGVLWNEDGSLYSGDIDIVEKKIKAFDIIKEKRVNVYLLIPSKTLADYNKNPYIIDELTQEEYNLLKEVLV